MNRRDEGWLTGLALGAGAFLAGRAVVRRMRHFDLKDRVVLITGGSRGLGLLMAREFCERGACVAICARDASELERAKRMLGGERLCLWTGACDVTKPEQVQELVGSIRRDFGHIDVLVNNAGVIEVGPISTMTLDDYQAAMATNFWAGVYATREVLDPMLRRGEGRIVNITSIGGKVAVPHLVPYSASKFAAVGWSHGLRAELKGQGVYVTTVVPGLMRTGSPRNADFKGQFSREFAWFNAMDSNPLTSMSARRAAARIVRACVNGEAEVTLSIQAKLAATFAGIFPGTTTEVMSVMNAMLPADDGSGDGRRPHKGRESRSDTVPKFLTALGDRAAVENNEVS
jgi:NAD(P)-dependent dehydrogenase (short-subunit alcohol dehydrogenase family)